MGDLRILVVKELIDGFSLEHLFLSYIVETELVAVYFGVLVLKSQRILLTHIDNSERYAKQDTNNYRHDGTLLHSLFRCKETVLPDDVGGLGRRLKLNLLADEMFVLLELGELLNDLVVLKCAIVSFFRLEGGEYRARSLKLIKQLLVSFDSIIDFVVDLLKFGPLLILDVTTALSKPVYYFRVVECKGDDGDSHTLIVALLSVIAETWHFGKSLLKLVLDEHLKLRNLRDRVGWVMISIDECLECFLLEVELNCVVSSCNSLDVPVHKLVLLYAVDVLQERQCEEIDENSPARHSQAD